MNFCAYELCAYGGVWLHMNYFFANTRTLELSSVAATSIGIHRCALGTALVQIQLGLIYPVQL